MNQLPTYHSHLMDDHWLASAGVVLLVRWQLPVSQSVGHAPCTGHSVHCYCLTLSSAQGLSVQKFWSTF